MHTGDAMPSVSGNSGIVNQNSPNSGNQSAGTGNTVTQSIAPAPPESVPDDVTAADLVAALRAVREAFERHRGERPGDVSDADADDAADALAEAEAEALRPEPEPRVIRRRIATITDALGSGTTVALAGSTLAVTATTLVESIARLQAVFLRLFGG